MKKFFQYILGTLVAVSMVALSASAATVITPRQGGTGLSTGPTKGDLLVGSSTATYAKLSVGTNGKCLTASSSATNGLSWETCASGGSGITSLNGVTTSTQTFSSVNDTNVTLSIASSTSNHSFTLGWTGTLAAGRLNSNVVQGVTNDTNVTGSISSQNLTLGWTGQLAETRGGTNQSTYSQGDLLYASAANTLSKLAKNTNSTRYLSNTGSSNNPAWAQIDLSNGVTGDLPFANLTQGSALSVLGVTGNATADNASIAAGSDHQVLRRSGTSVSFGAVNLAQSAAITGTLPIGNGGTGISTAPTLHGQLLMASSTGWVVGNLIPGSNITITTSTPGQITIASTASGGSGATRGYHTNSTSTATTTINWNSNASSTQSIILGVATTTFTFSNGAAGEIYILKAIQDGTGSRVVTWPAAVKFPGGVSPVLTTTASAVDVFTFMYDGTNYNNIGFASDVK